ncbi:WLM-domain-containing protein [Rhizodiscina lignyota]|uniref:WLM-domain-containing protein n=1 Tax=Rhizodiscina lignyota TaxID=1504668 RepID=A0A9P4IBR6_9PEZI|nr:WLM-domain-containing protein [Rhizodiscina lignyota]
MDLSTDAPEHLEDDIELTILHHGKPHAFSFSSSSSLQDLSDIVAAEFSIPESNQKFLVAPKVGLLKPPFSESTVELSSLVGKKITLMGSTTAEINTIQSNIAASTSSAARRGGRQGPVKAATPSRTRDWKRAKEEAEYTFHTLHPLPYLPRPERSLRFLEILRDDPGIRAAMRTHKFSVPLLTEMDPAQHTTHESRTLGLNRNRGEVIELRLRTDAYDGYRDYKTIRKTLCHELAHNVWGEHDRNFWDLTKQIEKEVERNDWTRGGHRLSSEEFYNPNDGGYEEGVADHGGWTGGEFVLGGGGSNSGGAETSTAAAGASPLSRREILARAAEERMKKAKDVEKTAEPGREGSSSSDGK